MTDLSFVRREMLPEKTPPTTSVGVIGWLRGNLFLGPWNSILTLVALFAVYMVLKDILPWTFRGVWNASSLDQCREIIKATYGPDVSAACWAVIHERFHQLMFGFYPQELYWRPILAFILLAVAVAPILFPGLPARMLAFSALYPFIGVWLMWGG
ncbi:MAG: amino acid ABC transporter permease, partial [Paracoccaceae bacterium]